jgi:tetratricopeptide (TPR) repeat protein
LIAPDSVSLGQLDAAETYFERAIAAIQEHADLQHLGVAYLNRATLWNAHQNIEKYLADSRRSAQLAKELGEPLFEVNATYNTAEAAYWNEDMDAAKRHAQHAIELARQLWGEAKLDTFELLFARIALYQEDLETTRSLLARVQMRLAEARKNGADDVEFTPADDTLLEMVDLASRNTWSDDCWEAAARRAESIILQPQEEVEFIEGWARAAQRAGMIDRSKQLLQQAMEVSRRKPNLLSRRIERQLAANLS